MFMLLALIDIYLLINGLRIVKIFFSIQMFLSFKMFLWHSIFVIIFFPYKIETAKNQATFDEIFGNGWDTQYKSEEKLLDRKESKNKQSDQKENIEFNNSADQVIEENETNPFDQMNNWDNRNIMKSYQNQKKEPNDQQKREIIQKFEAIKNKLKEMGKYKKKYQCKIEMKIGKHLGVSRYLIFKWKKEFVNDQQKTDYSDQQKRETVQKFDAIKNKLKEKGKYEWKNSNKIRSKILNFLGVSRGQIFKWKKEFNLNENKNYEQKKYEFIQRIEEFKKFYFHGKEKEFANELGICKETFRMWKKELMPNYNKNEHKLQKLKQYYEIKEKNSEMSDEIIAKELGIARETLRKWKKKFL